MKKRVAIGAALALVLSGCGKEIGRVALSGEGEGDASITVGSGDALSLWTALDVSYNGPFAASYAVELRDASGKAVANTACDPLNPSTRMSSVTTDFGDKHTARYSGKMRCELTAPTAGTFTVHTKLSYTTKPTSITVKDMSLVIKK